MDGDTGNAGAQRVGDWMMTLSGKRFWPLDPRPEDVDFRDIGHALSMLCRYNGHVRRFYSVAEHSVLLARYFEKRGHLTWAKYALLHDGTEAYVGDMVRPLKHSMPEFKLAEAKLERVIFAALSCGMELYPLPNEVKEADSRIIVDEASALWRPETLQNADWVFKDPPLGVEIEGFEPHRAERLFAETFARYFPGVPF